MKKILLFLILILSVPGCFDRKIGRNLKIVNTLNQDVYILNTFSDSLNMTYGGWDTSIFDQLYRAKKHSIYYLERRPSSWKSYIKISPQRKMRIYVIPIDSVASYGWKHIFTNYSKLNPIKVSYADLKKNKWEIILK